MLSFFPLDVLDEIWDVIESVSEGFFTYSWKYLTSQTYYPALFGFGKHLALQTFHPALFGF